MWKIAVLSLGLLLPSTQAWALVTIPWVTVGGAGNLCDTQITGCFGAVVTPYRISEHEVTNAQYAEFLNAVAATDTFLLYNASMGAAPGGIMQMGAAGSFTYAPIAGREQMPVNFVSFYDALRFANWLHNGQPTGMQDATTTEGGAYTITPAGIAANSIMRNAEATVFLPSEDEWYKAAYYDPSTDTYFEYPAGTDTPTVGAAITATANRANCNNVVGDLTPVGSYSGTPGSPSPNGTFDQGGNVFEWNEAILLFGMNRGVRGGSVGSSPFNLAASIQDSVNPTGEGFGVGFRVASLPEPATGRRGCN